MASMDGSCEQARGFKSSIFFVALYLVALGSGCLKPNMIAHGGDQFSSSGGSDNAKSLSTYFNSAYFSFCLGELVALPALVWVQPRSGMAVGFGIAAAAMAAAGGGRKAASKDGGGKNGSVGGKAGGCRKAATKDGCCAGGKAGEGDGDAMGRPQPPLGSGDGHDPDDMGSSPGCNCSVG